MRNVASLFATLLAAALRIFTRKGATTVPKYETSPEQVAYWEFSAILGAAEDADYEDTRSRTRLFEEWLEEHEYEERFRKEEMARVEEDGRAYEVNEYASDIHRENDHLDDEPLV